MSINDPRIPTDQPLLFSFDPGPHTGWVVTTQDLHFFMGGETDGEFIRHDFSLLLARLSRFTLTYSDVIIEDFTLTSKPKDSRNAKNTILTIGALDFICLQAGITPIYQIPNERKIASSKLLRSHGLWPARLEHAQSAARHLGAYLVKQRVLDPLPAMVG